MVIVRGEQGMRNVQTMQPTHSRACIREWYDSKLIRVSDRVITSSIDERRVSSDTRRMMFINVAMTTNFYDYYVDYECAISHSQSAIPRL